MEFSLTLWHEWILHNHFPPLLLLAQGQTQGSMLQKITNKTLTTGPFENTCKEDEVSLEVEAGGLHNSSVYNQAGT
jgi:hypothetical protein